MRPGSAMTLWGLNWHTKNQSRAIRPVKSGTTSRDTTHVSTLNAIRVNAREGFAFLPELQRPNFESDKDQRPKI